MSSARSGTASWFPLDPPGVAKFSPPAAPLRVGEGARAYLVRGASFSYKPAYTVVRFDDAAGGDLFVKQVTYDGEFTLPVQRASGPNAILVVLPRPPARVYVQAIIGGDGVFRGVDLRAADSR